MVVKLYHTYVQFPRNVRLPCRRIVTLSGHRELFSYYAL